MISVPGAATARAAAAIVAVMEAVVLGLMTLIFMSAAHSASSASPGPPDQQLGRLPETWPSVYSCVFSLHVSAFESNLKIRPAAKTRPHTMRRRRAQ